MNLYLNPEKYLVAPIEVGKKLYESPQYIAKNDIGSCHSDFLIYKGIEADSNSWMQLACDTATQSVKDNGGPFGAVIVQIDDETNKILRYWKTSNNVTLLNDPTAHAEILAIRSACASLGTFRLSGIEKHKSNLTQKGSTSHCEIYSSCEPCPMCYSAIVWARIPSLYFAANRFEAASPGVNFSDKEIYNELAKNYKERSIKVYYCNTQSSSEAFELWKSSDHVDY